VFADADDAFAVSGHAISHHNESPLAEFVTVVDLAVLEVTLHCAVLLVHTSFAFVVLQSVDNHCGTDGAVSDALGDGARLGTAALAVTHSHATQAAAADAAIVDGLASHNARFLVTFAQAVDDPTTTLDADLAASHNLLACAAGFDEFV
jgi:hypothetical protein